jgi:chromosome segregation protein
MGLFKKFKKEDKKENIENSQGAESNIDIKTTDDIQNEQVKNELDNLQNELRERNERLNMILGKIQISKKEYGEIIGKIIQSKKELRSNTIHKSDSQTDDLLKTKNQDVDRISKEINDSKITLRNIHDDITKNKEMNEKLEQKIKENTPFYADSKNQKKKIDEELEQRRKELEVLKKRLGEMKKTNIKKQGSEDSKSVVEAASQIVATTNKRLKNTMKELDAIRQLLDKERKAHAETKKKLQN